MIPGVTFWIYRFYKLNYIKFRKHRDGQVILNDDISEEVQVYL